MFNFSTSNFFAISLMILLIFVAGYIVHPFEKRAPKGSAVHAIKWQLLGALIFVVFLYLFYMPIIAIWVLAFGLIAFLLMLGVNKLRGKKFQFTSVTVSNSILALMSGVLFFVFMFYLAFR